MVGIEVDDSPRKSKIQITLTCRFAPFSPSRRARSEVRKTYFKMKTRILDHIDLRVKDFQRAMKFKASCCRRSVLPAIAPTKPGERSIRPGATSRPSFLDSRRIDSINRTAPGFHFGRTPAKEWSESQNLCARSAEKIWK